MQNNVYLKISILLLCLGMIVQSPQLFGVLALFSLIVGHIKQSSGNISVAKNLETAPQIYPPDVKANAEISNTKKPDLIIKAAPSKLQKLLNVLKEKWSLAAGLMFASIGVFYVGSLVEVDTTTVLTVSAILLSVISVGTFMLGRFTYSRSRSVSLGLIAFSLISGFALSFGLSYQMDSSWFLAVALIPLLFGFVFSLSKQDYLLMPVLVAVAYSSLIICYLVEASLIDKWVFSWVAFLSLLSLISSSIYKNPLTLLASSVLSSGLLLTQQWIPVPGAEISLANNSFLFYIFWHFCTFFYCISSPFKDNEDSAMVNYSLVLSILSAGFLIKGLGHPQTLSALLTMGAVYALLFLRGCLEKNSVKIEFKQFVPGLGAASTVCFSLAIALYSKALGFSVGILFTSLLLQAGFLRQFAVGRATIGALAVSAGICLIFITPDKSSGLTSLFLSLAILVNLKELNLSYRLSKLALTVSSLSIAVAIYAISALLPNFMEPHSALICGETLIDCESLPYYLRGISLISFCALLIIFSLKNKFVVGLRGLFYSTSSSLYVGAFLALIGLLFNESFLKYGQSGDFYLTTPFELLTIFAWALISRSILLHWRNLQSLTTTKVSLLLLSLLPICLSISADPRMPLISFMIICSVLCIEIGTWLNKISDNLAKYCLVGFFIVLYAFSNMNNGPLFHLLALIVSVVAIFRVLSSSLDRKVALSVGSVPYAYFAALGAYHYFSSEFYLPHKGFLAQIIEPSNFLLICTYLLSMVLWAGYRLPQLLDNIRYKSLILLGLILICGFLDSIAIELKVICFTLTGMSLVAFEYQKSKSGEKNGAVY